MNCSYASSHTKVWVQGFEASVLRREERISFLTNDLFLCAGNFSKFLAWQQVTVIQITELINDLLLLLSTVSLLYNSIEISSGLKSVLVLLQIPTVFNGIF